MIASVLLVTLCGAAPVPREGDTFTVGNERLERRFRILDGALRTIAIGEPGKPVAVSGDEFRIALAGGRILTSADFDVEGVSGDGAGRLEVDLAAKDLPLRARATYEAIAGRAFLRKRLELRPSAPSTGIAVESIDIERLAIPFPCAHQGLGEPAFLGPFFAGVEHPAGVSEVAGGVLSLRSHPGRSIDALPPARTAVIGRAPDADVRAAFLRYIATLRRPHVPDLFVNYNTWWTLMPPDEENCRTLIRLFREKLFEPHGETFDTFTIDDGWDIKDSLWRIRTDRFPGGFAPVAEALKTIRADLGLWLSPSSGYGHAPWGGSAGYEQASNEWYLCFGGPKYRRAIRETTLALARENHLSFYKFDGFFADCTRTDHGHPVGPAGREASVDGFIAMLDALRAQDPAIFLDPTSGMWLSPWWLAHSDAIWGSLAGDYPDPRVPSPTGRESATTTRDGVFRERCRQHPGFPPADMETLGLIVITPEPWQNNAAAVLARGSRLLTLYIDPKFLTEDRDWAFLASCLAWARSRAPILSANCTFLGGDPLAREPYGFAHVRDGVGIVGLRNPFEGDARISFALDRRLGFDEKTPDAMAIRVIFPYHTVLPGTHAPGSTIDVPLEGFEMKILEIVPAARVASLPRAARYEMISKQTEEGGRIRARYRIWEDPRRAPAIIEPPPESDLARDGATLEGGARIAGSDAGSRSLLLLLEPRGADPDAVEVRAKLDGKPLEIERRDGPKPHDAKTPLWVWYRAAVPAEGGNLAYAVGAAGADPFARARLWGWIVGERTLEAREIEMVHAAAAAPQPALLPIRSDRVRESSRLFGPAKLTPAFDWKRLAGERSIALERIPPEEARQDWGELRAGESVWQKPMTIAGTRFESGLGTHANAVLRYDIAGSGFDVFACDAGRDDAAADGALIFEVRVDGKTAFRSETLRHGTAAIPVRVSIRGARILELIAGDGGDGISGDHLDIAEPRLER
ncbi:MAG: NPCBM/NEW2 domain-containing protein [Planctomycetes bacterium]|nr:NPCBM/NEW2 domain-containing protein [Planctomycetota bacterium]